MSGVRSDFFSKSSEDNDDRKVQEITQKATELIADYKIKVEELDERTKSLTGMALTKERYKYTILDINLAKSLISLGVLDHLRVNELDKILKSAGWSTVKLLELRDL